MSSNVFLAPCDPKNFERTMLSPVDLNDYPDHPTELSGTETVRFWGARPGSNNSDNFEKMESGDLVLFYQDGEYVGSGWVGITFEDDEQWASTTFWNDTASQHIFTIQSFTPVSVPKIAVNRIFDYTDDYTPRGLMRVAANRVNTHPEAIKLAVEQYSETHE